MIQTLFGPAIWLMRLLPYRGKTAVHAILAAAMLVWLACLVEETPPFFWIVPVLWGYLLAGSYLGIRDAIGYLEAISRSLAEGELIETEPLPGNDEFGRISRGMNAMIGATQNNLKLLREYQGAVDNGTLVNKTNVKGEITYVNAAYEKLSGYTLEELRGKTHALLRSPNTSDLQIQMLWDTLSMKEVYRGIFENRAKDGSTFYVKSTILPIFDKHGAITEYLAIMSDITALKDHEKRLESQLYIDDLTGLPNRNAFHRAVSNALDPKMMLIDIDGFNTYNTIYGESVGDELIVQLGRKLQEMIAQSPLRLFRMAADEYAILADAAVKEKNFHEDVIMLAHYLNPLHLHCAGHHIRLRVSIGAVIASRNDEKRPLMAMASIALKEAKKQLQRSYFFYSEIADASFRLEQNLATVERLDYAIRNETIICHYQPIYDVRERRVCKYESLMRLVDAEGTVHAPSDFIGVAKGAHLYAQLTYQVVLNTLAMAALHPELYFTVNIDIEDIQDSRTTAFILEQLRQSTCAERIAFELVESKELEDNELVENFLKKLKSFGCRIAIDDFGSGYSNYGYLMKLGVDLIKIDGSLIVELDEDDNKRRIVQSIIDIAHQLGIETVAEYVRSREIFEIVRGLGIDYVQGAYISIAREKLCDQEVCTRLDEEQLL